MENNELQHHGILGMKWGVRRYQNKDGTLTKAGQKRYYSEDGSLTKKGQKHYDSEMAKMKAEEKVLKNRKATKAQLDKLAAKRKALDAKKAELDGDEEKKTALLKGKESSSEPKKTGKEMSEAELTSAIRKLELEKRFRDLQRQEVAELNPETVSKGREFIDEFKDRAIKPALQEAGKQLIRDSLIKLGKKALGLENAPDGDEYIDRLSKEVKKMNLEKQYSKLKEEAKAATGKPDSKPKEESKSEPDSKPKTEPKSEPKPEPKDDTPRAKATVEKDTRSAKEKWDASSGPIHDVNFNSQTVSDVKSTSYYDTGKRYLTLLEDKSRR